MICQYYKPISISLSPNTEKDDIWLAFKLLFSAIGGPALGGQPWREGNATKRLEDEFKKYLGVKYAFTFNSGRSALMAILSSLGLEPGEEALLQAITCNAVPNPVIWSELKPVFVDCDEKTFNIDVEDLRKKITPKSKVVIVQHTFGLPVDIDEILEVCRQYNLILIEDCAHSLGAEYKNKKVGTFGKAAFFSFSRDKVISSVYGGMATTNDDELAKKIKEYQEKIGYPSCFWIFQQLLHPILMNWFILPTYSISGKYLLIILQRLHILSKAVHWKEKRGERPDYFPKRLPEALACLALNQFKKLEKFNLYRRELAEFYNKELKDTLFTLPIVPNDRKHIFLRFSLRHHRSRQIIKEAWQKNFLIGDWYTTPIAPSDTKLGKMQYIPGSCPNAEKLAKETLNLPTHINISKEEAKKITDFLKRYGN